MRNRDKGWQCPKCGRVYGPYIEECKVCNTVDKPALVHPNDLLLKIDKNGGIVEVENGLELETATLSEVKPLKMVMNKNVDSALTNHKSDGIYKSNRNNKLVELFGDAAPISITDEKAKDNFIKVKERAKEIQKAEKEFAEKQNEIERKKVKEIKIEKENNDIETLLDLFALLFED